MFFLFAVSDFRQRGRRRRRRQRRRRGENLGNADCVCEQPNNKAISAKCLQNRIINKSRQKSLQPTWQLHEKVQVSPKCETPGAGGGCERRGAHADTEGNVWKRSTVVVVDIRWPLEGYTSFRSPPFSWPGGRISLLFFRHSHRFIQHNNYYIISGCIPVFFFFTFNSVFLNK